MLYIFYWPSIFKFFLYFYDFFSTVDGRGFFVWLATIDHVSVVFDSKYVEWFFTF